MSRWERFGPQLTNIGRWRRLLRWALEGGLLSDYGQVSGPFLFLSLLATR